ncbi:dienelactone hydrolase family protein [Sphingomonas panacisoli]|uniref:Dienelactone hydrolase family protein n=1 Tax=Sphingomonas panacisoli TaxID=1813879 RepID=A0A5B8LL12_9SPHN|nr:dienelactone hydrolase family protein [Sphingomonas panacisoli]QDZ08425.1 dienelactone hydrolase family protein [Sphingomonas panacisoli]
MAIVRQTFVYDGPGGPFEGVFAYDDEVETARPGVMVIPNVLGAKESDSVAAENLAKLGYVGFVADVYGQGKRTNFQSENPAQYMNELNADRGLLRDRLKASLDALKGFAFVDPARTAVYGYCFGGKCALDIARAGFDVLGVVSFHGVYDKPDWANASPIQAKVLVCHGWEDPIAPPDVMVALGRELSEGQADWQIHAYGTAGHAFTDKDRKGQPAVRPGVAYEERADNRSWEAGRDFLAELFG